MKLPIIIREDTRTPIYHQIEEQIKALIVSGHLEAGMPLPSIRVLAKDINCSVITTRRAYQNLEQGRYIKTLQGKGTFVAEVESERKEEKKRETVYHTLEQAIETGRRHDYSFSDITKMVEAIIAEKMNEG